MDDFTFRKISQLLATMRENVDGLEIPNEIRSAVHLGIQDIHSLFERLDKKRAQARRSYVEVIEAAGGFEEPRVGAITLKAILELGADALTDDALHVIVQNISTAKTLT